MRANIIVLTNRMFLRQATLFADHGSSLRSRVKPCMNNAPQICDTAMARTPQVICFS